MPDEKEVPMAEADVEAPPPALRATSPGKRGRKATPVAAPADEVEEANTNLEETDTEGDE